MSKVRYRYVENIKVALFKVALFKVTSYLFIKVSSDGLELEAVFQSLSPCFDAPVLTSPSG